MKQQLISWVEEDRPNWSSTAKVYDEATEERLRSLGYLD